MKMRIKTRLCKYFGILLFVSSLSALGTLLHFLNRIPQNSGDKTIEQNIDINYNMVRPTECKDKSNMPHKNGIKAKKTSNSQNGIVKVKRSLNYDMQVSYKKCLQKLLEC